MERPLRRFMFRLCLQLGYPHPDALLAQLSSSQISEWLAYHWIEPFGTPADDLRTGIIAAATVAPYRKKGAPAPKPQDFIPRYGPRRRQTQEEQMRLCRTITAVMGGQLPK